MSARLLALTALLGLLCCAAPRPETDRIYLLRSQATLAQAGWRGEWELECARRTLASLGAEPEVIGEERLADLAPGLLVLSNVRNMSEPDAEAVRAFCRKGGRVLATALTSYRQADGSPWQPNNFALADVLGADFLRWGAPDRMDKILLGKRNAMLVRPRDHARVRARFESGDPAILETDWGTYVAEDLLAPEDTAAPEVRKLLAELLTRLSPLRSFAPGPYTELPPPLPFRETLPEGERLDVLVEEKVPAIKVGSREVRAILTVGKPPALALYDRAGKLLRRSSEPLILQEKPYTALRITRSNGSYRWSAYRGEVVLVPELHGLSVLNRLTLEEYLAGVVPNEVPPGFPAESLKAMAVVARSYSLAHRGAHSGADLCDEVHCQVYGGLASEADSTTAAVLATHGGVLSSLGQPVDATFHAVCGGVGQDADRVWSGRGAAYLRGRPDTLESDPGSLASEEAVRTFLEHPPEDACCRQAGRFRWRESYSRQEMEQRLNASLSVLVKAEWHGLGRLKALRVTERGPLGRVEALEVEGEQCRYTVRGDRVRWLTSGGKIGAAGLNSTLFVVKLVGDRVELDGGGWGHGVGMCQEGAAGRARSGWKYPAILEHYYPGTDLTGPPAP
ncbi:SpoIID/LytB domain-containing protein [bacterium CPR1]|nr:SpoIID/LytB domain-containing protein [bacterium CPR1]